MANVDELAALRAELGALRDEVGSLRRSVADARGRVALSMRDQVCCPVCGARRIAHFATLPDRGDGVVEPAGIAMRSRGWRHPLIEGALEAYACIECARVELYVGDRKVFDSPELFTLLKSEDPAEGPYR